MVRATTVKKNAKAKAVNAKNSNQGDGIVATIILPPGKEHVLEDIKRVMADSILINNILPNNEKGVFYDRQQKQRRNF